MVIVLSAIFFVSFCLNCTDQKQGSTFLCIYVHFSFWMKMKLFLCFQTDENCKSNTIHNQNQINKTRIIICYLQSKRCHAGEVLCMCRSSADLWSGTSRDSGPHTHVLTRPKCIWPTLLPSNRNTGWLCVTLTVSTCRSTVPSPKNTGFRASTRIRSK